MTNDQINKKLIQQTEDNQNLQDFIFELIELENQNPGRYTEQYKELINKYLSKSSID